MRSLTFVQECTPPDEAKRERKLRLDRNRQAARYAATCAKRGAKRARPTSLDWKRHIVDSIDKEHPENTFDTEHLEGVLLLEERSRLKDRRDAAAKLRDGAGAIEERIEAAVHLMVGPTAYHKWTLCGKERIACELCGRRFAPCANGRVRQHRCVPVK